MQEQQEQPKAARCERSQPTPAAETKVVLRQPLEARSTNSHAAVKQSRLRVELTGGAEDAARGASLSVAPEPKQSLQAQLD